MIKIASLAIVIAFGYVVVQQVIPIVSIIATTNSPPDYMVTNLKDQIRCARRVGIVIRKPILRVMKKPPAYNEPPGLAYQQSNVIVLASYASYETMAHELGHIVDWQTKRKGPLFDKIRDYEIQSFANAVKDMILQQCQSHPAK